MSEKKQIQIETTAQTPPQVGQLRWPGQEAVPPTIPAPAEEKTRRKGLPADGEPWKASEHDMVVMGRLSRAIEGVPPAAMRRIAPWFSSLLAEAMREPAQGLSSLAAMADRQAAGWNPNVRAYEQG